MQLLTDELPIELPTSHDAPCLSLYQPTHRHYPDNQQDPIRFRNLVKTLEQSLRQKYPKREAQSLLEPLPHGQPVTRPFHHYLEPDRSGLSPPGAATLFPALFPHGRTMP